MNVSLRQLSHRFGTTPVLRAVSLEVRDRELFFLLGPSGCGKTTLLRLIAGFHQPEAGAIFFGDRPMNGVPPHRRNTSMVFQNYALWPHLSVAENVVYGLEVRRLSAAEKRERVAEALAIVQMERFADRSPNQLSGGQQQRVALARALVIRPDVLLLDEPLSNLDAKLRLEMRDEIRRIHAQTRITTIYVTHDQKEALSLADRLAVLRDGAVEQVGEPRTVYCAPANRFVADFIGESNWLPAEVESAAGDHLVVRCEFGRFRTEAKAGLASGQAIWLGFRPEAVRIGEAADNLLQARIATVTYLGDIEEYTLELSVTTRIKAFEQNPLAIRRAGTPVMVHVRPQNLMVLPR
jgi:iron(III) transport system ATP-binding protein